LTVCIPPFPASVYELLSLPVIFTDVAFVAVTVNVDEAPGAIDVGLAVIATVGPGTARPVVVPQPVKMRENARQKRNATEK
jgi:hypothetical protein